MAIVVGALALIAAVAAAAAAFYMGRKPPGSDETWMRDC